MAALTKAALTLSLPDVPENTWLRRGHAWTPAHWAIHIAVNFRARLLADIRRLIHQGIYFTGLADVPVLAELARQITARRSE